MIVVFFIKNPLHLIIIIGRYLLGEITIQSNIKNSINFNYFFPIRKFNRSITMICNFLNFKLLTLYFISSVFKRSKKASRNFCFNKKGGIIRLKKKFKKFSVPTCRLNKVIGTIKTPPSHSIKIYFQFRRFDQ